MAIGLRYFFYFLFVVLVAVTLQCKSSQPNNTGEGKMADKLFPTNSGIINVKTAYAAKGDGVTDDTAAIQTAITANIGKNKTLYFPNGIYVVSTQLEWRPASGGWTARLTFQGQSEIGTILKLKDNAPGYTNPATPRAVIYTASQTGGSYNPATGGGYNAFRNNILDLTVNTGSGNLGAVGIDFIANNNGVIENVTIKSQDGQGHTGILMKRDAVGPCLIKKVTIDGFDYGTQHTEIRYSVTFEHLSLRNQKIGGIKNEDSTLTIRDLQSTNTVPVIHTTDGYSLVTLIDANLSGGSSTNSAINLQQGRLFARNVTTNGYQSVTLKNGIVVPGTTISEYVSEAIKSQFASPQQSLNLSVQETPSYFDTNFANWANVRDFGATANDQTDDTAAIQAAIDSGKSTIYFPNGEYKVSSTISVRGSVNHLLGFGSNLFPLGPGFDSANAPKAMLRFEGLNDLIVEDFNFNRIYPIPDHLGLLVLDHDTPKTVTLKRITMYGVISAAYRATVNAGNLFLEDVSGQAQSTGWFFSPNQKIWARQFNPEGGRIAITNNGATLWILGIKTEGGGTTIETINGGKTEVLGGLLYPAYGNPGTKPAFVNTDSSVSLVYGTIDYDMPPTSYVNQVVETRGGETKTLVISGNRVVLSRRL